MHRRSVLSVAAALVLALVAIVGSPAAAFTFGMAPGATKCFTEELTTTHRVHVTYSMPKARAIFTSVYITAPDGTHIYDEKRNTAKGAHVVLPRAPGEYAVCFVSAEKRAPVTAFDVTLTVLAEFEVQTQQSIEYTLGQSVDPSNQKNKALMVQARYANDNLFAIHEEFRAHMAREARMRITTESAFTRATVMAVFTLLALGAVTFLGYLTLKRHLYSKKFLE